MLFVKQLQLQRDDSWDLHYCSEYKNKYNLRFHNLRRYGITALINKGIYPYRIWDGVRHIIPGISDVTMLCNKPITKDLIEAIEIVAK